MEVQGKNHNLSRIHLVCGFMNIVIILYVLNCRRQYQLLWRGHIILLRQKILPAEGLLAVKLWNLNHCLHQGLPDLQGHLYQRHDTKTAYQPPMTRDSFQRTFRHNWAWATLIHLQVCWALTIQQPEFCIINWFAPRKVRIPSTAFWALQRFRYLSNPLRSSSLPTYSSHCRLQSPKLAPLEGRAWKIDKYIKRRFSTAIQGNIFSGLQQVICSEFVAN